MTVATTRVTELERNVWGLIFRELNFLDQKAASAVCKRWRYILSKTLLTNPNYKIGSFNCFKDFYKDFSNSRHIILLDASGSMHHQKRFVEASQIASKLLDYLEPVIIERGIFIGSFGQKNKIDYVKTKAQVISYINDLSISGTFHSFKRVSEMVFKRLSGLELKVNTHVHVISDMVLSNGESIIKSSQLSEDSQKVTFHFYNVHFFKMTRFLPDLTEKYEAQKDEFVCGNKKRKLQDQLEFIVHPFKVTDLPPPKPAAPQIRIGSTKRPHKFKTTPVKFHIPPK